ncbi:transglycosylase SLT domain-containing protein (plasmid) [Streptomyces sp. NBC_01450]|uniref:transglycosylase SLT domain-containing protein n=1 Tax=Streptomyces sp. NBC_01450 TaxID=2903871 RepID=UPI002E33B19A|nr:transglycosylase SLT domain-containing protein [Streptomyces sp. NBC_01450]
MSGTSSSTKVAAAVGGMGCLAIPFGGVIMIGAIVILGGFTVLLFPIVIIYMFFHGLSFSGLSGVGDPTSDLSSAEQRCEQAERDTLDSDPEAASERASKIITGDGLGKLEVTPPDGAEDNGDQPCTVPAELFDNIKDAGGICDSIGPVIIASQIEYESGFNDDFIGLDGARGMSQVPQDAFKRIAGENADPTDSDVSIETQGKYLCELSGEIRGMVDRQEVSGDVLDLTLVAYHGGLEAVRQAKGIPPTDDAQKYVTGVRTWFASMEGVGPIPRKLRSVAALHDGGGAQLAPGATPAPTPTPQQ